MAFSFFVGIDVGKETLEVALFKEEVVSVANDRQAIKSPRVVLNTWLIKGKSKHLGGAR